MARTSSAGGAVVDRQGPPRELRAPPPPVPLVPVQLLPGSAAPGGSARPRPGRWAREGLQRLDAWLPRQARALPRNRDLRGHLRPDLGETESQLRAQGPAGPLYRVHSPLNQGTNVAGWSLSDTSSLTHLIGDFFLSCLRAAVQDSPAPEHLGPGATFLLSFLLGWSTSSPVSGAPWGVALVSETWGAACWERNLENREDTVGVTQALSDPETFGILCVGWWW